VIGQSPRRKEDERLITGRGRFIDDIVPPDRRGLAHLVLVRSTHAHARIAHLDVQAARRDPRVLLVVTGKDVAHLGPMPVNRLVPDMRVPPHPILAETHVHAAGTPVAAVVAEDPYAAYDALDLIGVEYEPLPALPEPEAALAEGAPLLFSGIDGNRPLTRIIREGDVHRAFAAAAHVVPLRVAQARISAVALEPRSVLASFDRSTDELTMWVSCQAPFRIRAEMLREACLILKSMWTNERTTFESTHYRLKDAQCERSPCNSPRSPCGSAAWASGGPFGWWPRWPTGGTRS